MSMMYLKEAEFGIDVLFVRCYTATDLLDWKVHMSCTMDYLARSIKTSIQK